MTPQTTVPVIPYEDEPIITHTDAEPFCFDPTCGCHTDPVRLDEVGQDIDAGLLTPQEAEGVRWGRVI